MLPKKNKVVDCANPKIIKKETMPLPIYEELTYRQLRFECSKNGLSTKGKKAEMIKRLNELRK